MLYNKVRDSICLENNSNTDTKVAMTETSTKHNYRYTLFSNEILKNRPIGVALVFPFFTCCVLLKFRRLEK